MVIDYKRGELLLLILKRKKKNSTRLKIEKKMPYWSVVLKNL